MHKPENHGIQAGEVVLVDRFADLVETARTLSTPGHDGSNLMQDPYHQAGAKALAARLGDEEHFPVTNMLYRNVLNVYPDRSPHNIVQNGVRVANMYFRTKYLGETELPANLISPEGYDEYYDSLEHNDPSYVLRGDFADYFDFNVQTTIAQRSALVVGALALLGKQRSPLKLLDMGCGGNHSLLAATLPERWHKYEDITVMERTVDGDLIPNADAGRTFTDIVNRKLKVETGIGVDIQEEDDHDSLRYRKLVDWRGGCFYLSEQIENAERVWTAQLLELQRPDNIHFYQGDITRMKQAELQQTHPDFLADVATYLTVGNQLGVEGTERARERSDELLAPDGTRIWCDFVTMRADGSIEFPYPWLPYDYKCYVEDKTQPDKGPQLFFTAKTSRVTEIIIEPAAARFALEIGIPLTASTVS